MHASHEHAQEMIGALMGLRYNDAKAALDLFDWSCYWPEVNADGELTGEITEADEGWTLTDINEDGSLNPGDGASDAAIRTSDLRQGRRV